MKKPMLIPAILFLFILMPVFSGCQKNNELTTVKLNEVVHSIFYAPQYVAIEKKFFEDEGLKIDLSVGQGADKSMTALISGDADIALLGTEAGIYVFNEGRENYAVAFAQLTQRAGNFLVSREPEPNFSWENIRGKTIIGGRAGGMPQMVLEYVLKLHNIDPVKDVEILTNLQFTSTAGAFAGNIGDYTAEFDPSAYSLEKEGVGYVVSALGMESGKVPYTVYMAMKNFAQTNPEMLQKFTNAVYRGQIWVEQHSAREIAEVVSPHFPESSLGDLEFMVERYKSQDVWRYDPTFEEEGFERIQDIMESGGELTKRVKYDSMINTTFAEGAVKNIKK